MAASPIVINQQHELESKALSWPDRARSIQVVDQETCGQAGSILLDVAAMRKQIQEHHGPLKSKAFEAHKAICNAESKLLEPVAEAERILKSAISTYQLEERRKAEEERRRLEREALRREEEAREAEIMAAESEGVSVEEVQALIEQPIVSTMPVVAAPPPRAPQGLAMQPTYRAVVTNFDELLRAVVDGKAPKGLIQVNESALGQLARALKKTFQVPGVRLIEELSVKTTGRGR